MSAKALVAVVAAAVLVMTVASGNAQAPPPLAVPTTAVIPAGQASSQPAVSSPPAAAGSPQTGTGPAPISRIISPPNTSDGLATAPHINNVLGSEPSSNAAAGSGSNLVRTKRQAGIPPVCCTKDPCDPCATTPCIACPLCG